jgi:hypothetical protein
MAGIAERQVRSRAESSWGSQPQISPPVPTDCKSTAIPRFFANYVSQSKVLALRDLRFVTELCGQPNVSELLREALDAVAWLNLSNQVGHGMDWLPLEAQQSCKSCWALRAALQDEEEARKDTTLQSTIRPPLR